MSTSETTLNGSSLSSKQETLEDVLFPPISQKQLAWQDIKTGLINWRVWLLLAYQDIKLRYYRSVLGPLWITLSMAITVYSMGYLYSHLFHMNVGEYFPYLVAGMLGWSLVSTNIMETVDTFTANESLLKQIKLPYSMYVHRIVTRNMFIFFHNILVIIPVMVIFHNQVKLDWHILFIIPGLAIIYFNSICYGLVFGLIGARYRDISQLIKSLIQVIFFLTPVMWNPSILPPNKQFIANLNPVYTVIELIRAPLLGYPLTTTNLVMIIFTSLIGLVTAYVIFVPKRARIIYWV